MASLNNIETKVQNIIDILNCNSITGTLPLTFTSKAGNVVNWTIYGNAEGVGERTKNVLDISSFEDVDLNNVVMILNDDNATVTVHTTEIPTANVQQFLNFDVAETGNYLFSGVPANASNVSLNMFIWDKDANSRAKAWDKTADMTTQSKNSLIVAVYLEAGVRYQVRLRVQASYGKHEDPVIVSPMIRLDGTTDSFIPYGYQAPITISQLGQTDKNYNFYIGDSLLTEGETISKSSTGVDIELFEGENTVSTTLINKPEMTIKYKNNGGN